MAFLHKHQIDDVFFINITIAMLNLLNDKLYITNVISDTETTTHNIPFFYNSGGDERFLQDVFLSQTMNDMIDTKKVEGNIDVIPRGVITLEGITIQESNLTNRFVYGEFLTEIDGIQEKMVAPTNVLPLELSYTCEIRLDTKLNTFKCASRIIKSFYRSHPFRFISDGYVLEAEVSFPSDISKENSYEFSFGDAIENKITFDLAVETNMPVVDETQIRKKINVINSFEVNYNVSEGLINKNAENISNTIEMIHSGMIIDYNQSVSKLNNSTSIYTIDDNIKNPKGNIGSNIYTTYYKEEYIPLDGIINIDNNIHDVSNFGIPNETLDNFKKYKK